MKDKLIWSDHLYSNLEINNIAYTGSLKMIRWILLIVCRSFIIELM